MEGHRYSYEHRYIILLIVLIGVFMSVLDSVVVAIALPNMTSYFNVGISDSQWVVTTYPIVETSFLIICGKISERTGRANMFIVGLGVFTASSLLCSLSTDLNELILFRILQGIGASMLFSISAAICFQVFGKEERGRVMGFLGSTVAVASLVGPAIGGLIVGTVGWQYIFWINVPIGIIAFIIGAKMLRLHETKSLNFKFDYIGAVLWVGATVALMLLVGKFAEGGSLQSIELIYLIAFVLALAGFIFWERRTAEPLLDISVFRNRRFTFTGISMAIFFISSTMVSIVGPFYYEGVMGLGPEQVGVIFMILPAIMMIGSPIIGRRYDRTQSKYYSPIGQLVRGVSLLLLAYAFFAQDLVLTLIAFVIMGLGGSMFQSTNNTEIMIALPKEKTGVASSVSATVRNMAIALGLSLGTILLVMQMGTADYTAMANGPLSLLANAVSFTVMVAGAVSLLGGLFSLVGNMDRSEARTPAFNNSGPDKGQV